TPREIVSYMVDESLKEYLLQKLTKQPSAFVELGKDQTNMFGNEAKKGQLAINNELLKANLKDEVKFKEQLEILFNYGLDQNPFSPKETELLITAVSECKILDPACGSGAFPMGVLHRMVNVLSKLDPNNQHWKQALLNKA